MLTASKRSVRINESVLPSNLLPPPHVRPLLHSIPSPRLPPIACSKRPPHQPPPLLYPSHDLPLPPTPRKRNLLFRPTPILPRLGPRERPYQEDHESHRAQGRAAQYGAFQTKPLRKMDGSRWLGAERWRLCQHPRQQNLSMGG